MLTMVAVRQRLASACAVFFGRHGDVSRQAQARGQSRQSLYRETAQVVEAVAGQAQQAQIQTLTGRLAEQETRLQELGARLEQSVEISEDTIAEFASTAQAEGVSLPVARRLLATVLGERTPSVATLGRFSTAASERARSLLEVLDEASRPQVTEAAADEIFLAAARY
jgi:hypothetical protein